MQQQSIIDVNEIYRKVAAEFNSFTDIVNAIDENKLEPGEAEAFQNVRESLQLASICMKNVYVMLRNMSVARMHPSENLAKILEHQNN